MPPECPNLLWPIWQNRQITDPQELKMLGYPDDFQPKSCGFDLTQARPDAVRCPKCGRPISGI